MDNGPKQQTEPVLLEHLVHKAQRCIALRFPYDAALVAAAKEAGAKWSRTHRCWYTPNSPGHLQAIFAAFKGKAWVDMNGLRKRPAAPEAIRAVPAKRPAAPPATRPAGNTAAQARHSPKALAAEAALSPIHEQALAAIRRKLEVGRYSPRSITVYLGAVKQLFLHFPRKHPNDIRTEDIEAFQHHLATVRKVSNSTLNQAVNAIRYYYLNVLGDAKRVTFMERPRKEKKLPTVLSEEEVAALLRSVDNLKHRDPHAHLLGRPAAE